VIKIFSCAYSGLIFVVRQVDVKPECLAGVGGVVGVHLGLESIFKIFISAENC
jgi:hypothetical protein